VVLERKMHFTKCALLMQDLLVAKRDLRLSREIKRLGRYDGLIIDDLGYLQQSRDDMEVVFTLLAERYERGSVLMTSKRRFENIITYLRHRITNAASESINAKVLWVKYTARGFRLYSAENIGRTTSLVLVVSFGDPARRSRHPRAHVIVQRHRFLINANHRRSDIQRPFVCCQDVFHFGDVLTIEFGHGRGRDAGYPAPPAQIPTGGTTA
jgi:hypothetical protein